VRASRLIVFGLIAVTGAVMERPAAADIVIGDETTPLKAAVCLDVPAVFDLHIGLGLGVPEPCARPVDDAPPPPAPVPDPVPVPVPVPAPPAAVPTPVIRSVAAPQAVEPAPVTAPPVVTPTQPAPARPIRSDRPAPTPPPNPFGSTVALVVVAAAVAGGTNVLFRSS
jgi:hypothetical protein